MATQQHTADALGLTRNGRIFEQEFFPLMDAVHAFAIRLTNDANRADDLTQETFLKAWRSADTYSEGTNAKGWLFRICHNAFVNEYRIIARQPRKVDYEDIVVYHNEDDPVTPRYYGLREELGGQQAMLGDEVTRAIELLPINFREVLLLDMEDFSYDEIAKLLEIPIGTVRSRLHRARNILADQLRQYAKENGINVGDSVAEQPSDNNTATAPVDDTPAVAAPTPIAQQ
jgi:RNA polymerase sigma factor (sigma-70 family)